MAEGEYVIVHGRFSGNGRPAAFIAADIVRIEERKVDRALGHPSGRGDESRIKKRTADELSRYPGNLSPNNVS
jgi:hypothetical protein